MISQYLNEFRGASSEDDKQGVIKRLFKGIIFFSKVIDVANSMDKDLQKHDIFISRILLQIDVARAVASGILRHYDDIMNDSNNLEIAFNYHHNETNKVVTVIYKIDYTKELEGEINIELKGAETKETKE